MTARAECEKCGHKWDLEMKPMETITCPNCKTVYNALIVVNDPENKEIMRIVREHSEVEKMNEEYFEHIRNLCKACGLSIDRIAKQFNIKQNLVAKLFMETMQTILSEVEK